MDSTKLKSKLYGIGVGPGDPELLTLKAVRIIRESAIIAVPGTVAEESVAYHIVQQAIPEFVQKKVIPIDMPMTKDAALLEQSHRAGARIIKEYLEEGKQVAFLTLGDPTVYSTYLYIHKLVDEAGFPTEIVSGITSFCAVAAKLNTGLVEKSEILHVVPSSYGIEDTLKLPGTKVLMKAGKKMPQVKAALKNMDCSAAMIENCGMENEKIYRSADEIDDNAGYYSLIIVKDNNTTK